jgi:hypothetical protein
MFEFIVETISHRDLTYVKQRKGNEEKTSGRRPAKDNNIIAVNLKTFRETHQLLQLAYISILYVSIAIISQLPLVKLVFNF